MSDCKITKAFYRWLKRNSGRKVRIEDFRKKHDAPDVDWQRAGRRMSPSPAPRLHADFPALFGCQFERASLIQLATSVTDDAGGLAVNHADCVTADEL